MRCLLILAHPRRDSLCGALFDTCRDGARQAGVECRELILRDIRFDSNVHEASPEQQPLEPYLVRAQRDIHWAEHLVFVYPTWRGTFPALLKGFLDRIMTPGFAFRHVSADKWDELLASRTADLIRRWTRRRLSTGSSIGRQDARRWGEPRSAIAACAPHASRRSGRSLLPAPRNAAAGWSSHGQSARAWFTARCPPRSGVYAAIR